MNGIGRERTAQYVERCKKLIDDNPFDLDLPQRAADIEYPILIEMTLRDASAWWKVQRALEEHFGPCRSDLYFSGYENEPVDEFWFSNPPITVTKWFIQVRRIE